MGSSLLLSTALLILSRITTSTAFHRWIPVEQRGEEIPSTLSFSRTVAVGPDEVLVIGGMDESHRDIDITYWDSGAELYTPEYLKDSTTALSSIYSVRITYKEGTPVYEWTRLGDIPIARGGAYLGLYNGTVIMWGGFNEDVVYTEDVALAEGLSKVYTWNPILGSSTPDLWVSQNTTGAMPVLTSMGASVIYKDAFITLGGALQNNGTPTNTSNILNLTTYEWSQPSLGGAELPTLYGHTAVLVEAFPLSKAVKGAPEDVEVADVIFIVGGSNDAEYTDVGVSSCEKNAGRVINLATWMVYELKTETTPGCRTHLVAGLTNSYDGSRAVYVTGGLYLDAAWISWVYSDVWKFSLETLEWEEVIIANPSAVPGRWGGINISPVSTEAFGLGFGSSIPYVTFNDSWVIVDYSGNATQSSLKLIDGTGPNGYPVAGTSFTYSLQIHDRRGYPIDYGSEHVSAVAIDTLGRSALGLVRDQQNGTYTITFGTRYAGDFALFISYNGESIFGVVGHMDLLVYPGPLSLTHSYLDVGSLEGATVGGNSTIVIRLVDEQGNPLREEEALHSTTVTVDNGSALTETALGRRDILPLELTYVNGSVTALFDPPAPGIYYLNVRVDGEPIAGSPFSITATIPPKASSHLDPSNPLAIVLLILVTGELFVAVVAFIIYTIAIARTTSVIVKRETCWAYVMLLAAAACSLWVSFVIEKPSVSICTSQRWLMTGFFSMSAVALLGKAWSIRQRWENPHPVKFVVVPVRRLLRIGCVVLPLQLLLLVIWATISPSAVNIIPNQRSVCITNNQRTSQIFATIIAVMNNLIYLVAAFAAVQGREGVTSPSGKLYHIAKGSTADATRDANIVAMASALQFGINTVSSAYPTVAANNETWLLIIIVICMFASLLGVIFLIAPSLLRVAREMTWLKPEEEPPANFEDMVYKMATEGEPEESYGQLPRLGTSTSRRGFDSAPAIARSARSLPSSPVSPVSPTGFIPPPIPSIPLREHSVKAEMSIPSSLPFRKKSWHPVMITAFFDYSRHFVAVKSETKNPTIVCITAITSLRIKLRVQPKSFLTRSKSFKNTVLSSSPSMPSMPSMPRLPSEPEHAQPSSSTAKHITRSKSVKNTVLISSPSMSSMPPLPSELEHGQPSLSTGNNNNYSQNSSPPDEQQVSGKLPSISFYVPGYKSIELRFRNQEDAAKGLAIFKMLSFEGQRATLNSKKPEAGKFAR